MAVSLHDATPMTSGNSYTTSVDATPGACVLRLTWRSSESPFRGKALSNSTLHLSAIAHSAVVMSQHRYRIVKLLSRIFIHREEE